jgi:intein/homing endonuclease
MLDQDASWIPITEISINTGVVTIYNLNVEEDDVYFAEGMLVHNKS